MIKDKIIRKKISSILKELRLKAIKNNNINAWKELKISNIDEMIIILINSNSKNCTREIDLFAKKEVEIAKLSVLALGLLSFAVSPQEEEAGIIPPDWLNKSTTPNPNFILQCLLAQATNHALAILNLSLNGLDNSSRIILRVYHELCWLIPILISNKEKMELYRETADESVNEKKIWREHFSFNKLNQSLIEIEDKLGIDSSIIQELSDIRRGNDSFYSKSIHNSYSTTMVCSYALKSESEEEINKFALFGEASLASKNTLDTMNWATYYLLALLYKIFAVQYKFKASPTNEFFAYAHALFICQSRILLKERYNIELKSK